MHGVSMAPGRRLQRGIAADPDNPGVDRRRFQARQPFAEVFPEFVGSRRERGPQKELTKVAVSLRLSRDVVERFKADGPGWQTRMDEARKKAAGLNRRYRCLPENAAKQYHEPHRAFRRHVGLTGACICPHRLSDDNAFETHFRRAYRARVSDRILFSCDCHSHRRLS